MSETGLLETLPLCEPLGPRYRAVTDGILSVFFKTAYPQLGHGFVEPVYRNALAIALARAGLAVRPQAAVEVYFHGQVVGQFNADLLVDEAVIVLLRAAPHLLPEHDAQLVNCLRATPYEVGLLLNFGLRPEFRRRCFENSRKTCTWQPPGEPVGRADPQGGCNV